MDELAIAFAELLASDLFGIAFAGGLGALYLYILKQHPVTRRIVLRSVKEARDAETGVATVAQITACAIRQRADLFTGSSQIGPILADLEHARLISSKDIEDNPEGEKRRYRLTETGEILL